MDQTKLMSWFESSECPDWAMSITVADAPTRNCLTPVYWSLSVAELEDMGIDWKNIQFQDFGKAVEAGEHYLISGYTYVGESVPAALDRPAPDWVLKELAPLPEDTEDDRSLSEQLVGIFTGTRSIDEIPSECIGGIPSADEVFPAVDDNVNHPSHYTSHPSGVECIEITEHYDFCVGNAIKYLWRAGLKQDADKTELDKELEDLQKAKWYIDRKISLLTKNKEEK